MRFNKMAIATGGIAAALALAPVAQAEDWVADESASICNSLYLEAEAGGQWITTNIQMLQMTHDISRSEAVAGIRQAALEYCPEYSAAVPAK